MGFFVWFTRLSKVSFSLALVCIIGAFILGWIGYAVPDWLSYSQVTSSENKFGLWSYCVQPISVSTTGYSCQSWTNAFGKIPDFIKTVRAMMSLGVIFITITLIIAVVAMLIKKTIWDILMISAMMSTFIAFLFLLIGLIVFAGDFHNYVVSTNGSNIWRRWGYWIFVPTMILLGLAAMFFPYNYIFRKFIEPRYYKTQEKKKNTIISNAVNSGQAVIPSNSSMGGIVLIPTSKPGYYREYRSPGKSTVYQNPIAASIIPAMYGEVSNTPGNRTSAKQITADDLTNTNAVKLNGGDSPIIRENVLIQPIFDKANYNKAIARDMEELSDVYELADQAIIIPPEATNVNYKRNKKNDSKIPVKNDKKWDWEKVDKN